MGIIASCRSKAFFGRLRLVSSTGVAGILIAASAGFPVARAADESVTRRVETGARGANGRIVVFGHNVPGERGGDGPALTISNIYSTTRATGTAVTIGSVGGNGGEGNELLGFNTSAGFGGNGGAVSVDQKGVLAGTGPQTQGNALLSVYSQGGAGGGALHGFGGGGNAGNVDLKVSTSITTSGALFAGVWARSAGGNAGRGGVTQGLVASNAGGNAGNVKVTIARNGSVATNGKNAPAVIVESLGGHGGNRGNGYLSDNWASRGGNAGEVTFENFGSVSAIGENSSAILVQSVGGSGGDQGSSGGDPGGPGGNAGKVSAIQWSKVVTSGAYNFGILAQSLGGSGGAGGASDFFSGGDGGAAGAGSTVSVANYGTITTSGKGSTAIVAQSVGGGNAANAFSLGPVPQPAGGGNGGSSGIFFGSGGTGGTGGDGNKVSVTNGGHIITTGEAAFGILAQSVGGGGGSGGKAVTFGPLLGFALGGRGGGGGNGGDVEVLPPSAFVAYPEFLTGSSDITTSGNGATGIVALSIGGSGGIGGTATARSATPVLAIAVAIGGAGGQGGSGGKVTVANSSAITTAGIQAFGIDAKSIGGGGGNAGNASAYALSLPAPGVPSISVTYAAGGTGGKGGNGGVVNVSNSSEIRTTGAEGKGIQAMSVGGGGGSGGAASSMSDMLSFYLNVGVTIAVGGTGGEGGNGAAVIVSNSGIIETFGSFSPAISAQSIGGGGGSGGTANAVANAGLSWNDKLNTVATTALPIANSFTARRTVGGSGAVAGNGDAVTITNTGSLISWGANSPVVFAQSIGGGGGDSGGYLASGKGNFSVNSSVGGLGGGGGNGGAVTVTNSSNSIIETHGVGSIGILAQSVGGGGGIGGMWAGSQKSPASASQTDIGKTVIQFADELIKIDKVFSEFLGSKEKNALKQYSLLDKNSDFQKKLGMASDVLKIVKILADGNKSIAARIAEAGGTVIAGVLLDAFKDGVKNIYKEFSSSAGVNLPSISLEQSVGGSGGKGGAGGDVTVLNDGTILTYETGSWAVFAQSIGGGGGFGGAAAATGNNKMNISATVGGSGSDGGKGGDVKVTNNGMIASLGGGAFGILAQSIGGGGGTGGAASSANTISLAVTSRVGGNAGKSSDGGKVTIINSGTISTLGKEAHAIVAQSVGGGGGLAYVSRYDPSDPANLANSAEEYAGVKTSYDLMKDFGLNVGGGTSDTSSTLLPIPSLLLSIGGDGMRDSGGSGGAGGSGAEVSVTHSGTISTAGIGAFGIFAQSIGGGGGFGADVSNGTSELAIKGTEGGVGLLGGSGGVGGNGGHVIITLGDEASISTTGMGANAIFAQSIGGGGGYGGVGTFTVTGLPKDQVIKDSAASGNGGLIEVKMGAAGDEMDILTTGARANGIFAQSIGGGGGTVFDLAGNGIPLTSDAKGRTGAAGVGGAITIDTVGQILAQGAGSYAIFAQSGVQKTDGTLDASRLGGNINITHQGDLLGGSGATAAAIRIDGGNANRIDILSGSSVSAASNVAILGSFGTESVYNSGTIEGAIDLVSGRTNEANYFYNLAGGTYRSHRTIDLGTGGLFRNEGTFHIGDDDSIARVIVNGNFQQTSTGKLMVDVSSSVAAHEATSDRLDVNGNLTLAGQIKANVIEGLKPQAFQVAIATGTIDLSALASSASNGSPFNWSVYRDGNSVFVKPTANFATPAGFTATGSEQNVMRRLQDIWGAGNLSAEATSFFGYLAGANSASEYIEAIDSLAPEETASTATQQTLDAQKSMHASLSCPVFEGSGTLMQESDCAWARIIGNWTQQTTSAAASGFNQSAITYRVGVQKEIISDWFLGATAGFTQSWLNDASGYSSTQGNGADAAVSLKHQIGPWLFAVSGHLGFGSYDYNRIMDFGSSVYLSSGTSNVLTAAGRFRASYEFAFPQWYVKPYVDLDVLYTYLPGYEEDGSTLSLNFATAQQWNFAVTPTVEFGGRFDLSPDLWLRPYASVGVSFYQKDSMAIGVSLNDATGTVGDFTTEVSIPSTLVRLGAGAQLFSSQGYEIRAEYKADIGDNYLSQELSARFAVPF